MSTPESERRDIISTLGKLLELFVKTDVVTKFHLPDSDDHSLVCPLTGVSVRFPSVSGYPKTYGSILYELYSSDARELRVLDDACPGHWHHMPVTDIWFDEDETGATTEWPRGYQI